MRVLIHSRNLILTRDMRRRIEGRVRLNLAGLDPEVSTVRVGLVALESGTDEIEVSLQVVGTSWESRLFETHPEYLKAVDRALARAEKALSRRSHRLRRRKTAKLGFTRAVERAEAAERRAS